MIAIDWQRVLTLWIH